MITINKTINNERTLQCTINQNISIKKKYAIPFKKKNLIFVSIRIIYKKINNKISHREIFFPNDLCYEAITLRNLVCQRSRNNM